MNTVDWALLQDLSAPKKLLLVTLAWVSDDNAVTFKGQKTLATRLGKEPRWVREHLPSLAEEKLITRYRRHRADGMRTSDLIVLNVPRDEPVDLENYSGIVGDREPSDSEPTGGNPPVGLEAGFRQPTGGNPPPINQPANQPVDKRRSRARDPNHFPADLPTELRGVATKAGLILKETAEERGQKRRVTPAAVGHAVLSYPDRDHEQIARDVQAYVLHGRGATESCRDIVARYRRFLTRADPMPGPPLRTAASSRPSGSSAKITDMVPQLRARAAAARAKDPA